MDSIASSYQVQNLTSIKQALNVSVMRKALNQDEQSVDSVMKAMEQSVTPYKGQSIDLKV